MSAVNIAIERYISNLEPGDQVNLDSFEATHGPALRRTLELELEGRGFVLNSRGCLGEIEICTQCCGDGILKGLCCPACDGFSTVVDFGRGKRPFKQ